MPPPVAAQNGPAKRSIEMVPKIQTKAESPAYTDLEDALDRILMSVEARDAARESSATQVFDDVGKKAGKTKPQSIATMENNGGPLTTQEVSYLSMLCTSLGATPSSQGVSTPSSSDASPQQGWATVDPETIITLTPMLEAHIESASCVDFVGEALHIAQSSLESKDKSDAISIDQWIQPVANFHGDAHSPGTGFHRMSILRRGLEASSVLLSIMTSPGIDPRVVSEDGIEGIVALLRQHLTKNVIPALTNTGHQQAPSQPSPKPNAKNLPMTPPPSKRRKTKTEEIITPPPTSDRKRKSKPGGNHKSLERALKKVYKPILASIGLLS
eukprot:scaffold644544_cov55-Attheya_sp.AAC.1